jgi:hypothetical protein
MTDKPWMKIPIYAGAGTVGSLFLGYGLRLFLRTWFIHHSYYGKTANLVTGSVSIFIGWMILFVVAVYLYRDLSNQ